MKEPDSRSATMPLAWDFLTTPSRAAKTCASPGAFVSNLRIYLIFMAASLIFFQLKPADFPDANIPIVQVTRDFSFWLGMILWQPVLEAAWIVFILGLLRWFAAGSWSVRLMTAVAWTALPFILMILRNLNNISLPGYVALLLLWSLPLFGLIRAAPKAEWRTLAGFMMGINAIGLAILPPMALAVGLKAPGLFTFTQAAGGLWILGAGMLGLRELSGLRLPRAFMAVLLSMFLQIAFAFTLHLLGLIPKDMLKALFYA